MCTDVACIGATSRAAPASPPSDTCTLSTDERTQRICIAHSGCCLMSHPLCRSHVQFK